MGSDQSKLKGLEIDKKAVEVTDFWSLYNAELPKDDGSTFLSIFQSDPVISGHLWVNQSPLDRATKNLMIYRHPCILKYIASWDRGSQKYLATERCRPLSLVVQTQSDIQICLGLRNILCSLIFLVEHAKARHINICSSSIYVNFEGAWRLAGFEHVWKTKELTKKLLDHAKPYRYNKAVDPNEQKVEGQGVEQYAYAVLCDEILKNHKTENTPYVSEFRDYCNTHLKHQNVSMRPKLSAVLLHPYFNHEFVLIHSFLTELPLKNLQEKQDFFTGLIDKLRYFDEALVASQFGTLLLSRMVLLDTTAQLCVTPYVLKTKNDITAALFSQQIFKTHIVPIIKQIFCVRDAQIRLILLEYFNDYVNTLTNDELREQILPNLLLGIKDINDVLVAKTLRCLADLVPILGSEVVIGGNRGRLFSDGRPQGPPETISHWVEPRSITPVMAPEDYIVSASPLPDNCDVSEGYLSVTENVDNQLPIRLSPDGGEDIHSTTDAEIEDDAWSDWDNEGNQTVADESKSVLKENNLPELEAGLGLENNEIIPLEIHPNDASPVTMPSKSAKTLVDDINALDIKNKKFTSLNGTDEIDFFKDMEPVIEISRNNILAETSMEKEDRRATMSNSNANDLVAADDVSFDVTRFQIAAEGEFCESGWDEEINDWNDDPH